MPLAERLIWAVETLDVQPDDQLLEIGCGHGLVVSLIADKLGSGKITAIDRSEAMTKIAAKRNAAHIAAGKVEFHTVELADFGGQQFNKIFAVNVNLFWMKPEAELKVIQNLLMPCGKLYLFYQPPGDSKVPEVVDKVSRNLEANSFAVRDVLTKRMAAVMGVCITAQKN